jgi:DNA repair photolyase
MEKIILNTDYEQPMVRTRVLRPSGTGFLWCINQYNGCAHGCKYCYGMSIRKKKYEDWIQATIRKNVIEDLQKDIKKLKSNNITIRDIFVGSICDSYQPLENKLGLTRSVIELLIANELPFTILTKNDLVLRDIDLFKGYGMCRVGVTITSLSEDFRRYLEPGTVSYEKRIEVLRTLKKNNVSTYLSCEPIFPVKEANPIDIVEKLKDIVDLFEFGLWNRYRYKHLDEYYYRNYSIEYYAELFYGIIRYCDKNKINYCIASHSREFIEEIGLQFKPHPMIKQ